MLTTATLSLKKLLAQTNALVFPVDSVKDITFEEAKNPASAIYVEMSNQQHAHHIQPSVKAHLITLHCLQQRCLEEISLLKSEVQLVIEFYNEQLTIIRERVEESQEGKSENFVRGLHSLLRGKEKLITFELVQLHNVWKTHFQVECINITPPNMFELVADAPVSFLHQTSIDDESTLEFDDESDIVTDCEESSEDEDEDECMNN